MTRFFFDIQNDGHFEEDEVGLEFADEGAAAAAALRTLGEIARDSLRHMEPGSKLSIRVRRGNDFLLETSILLSVMRAN